MNRGPVTRGFNCVRVSGCNELVLQTKRSMLPLSLSLIEVPKRLVVVVVVSASFYYHSIKAPHLCGFTQFCAF